MRERCAELEVRPYPAPGDELVIDVIRKGVDKANVVAEGTPFAAQEAMTRDFAPIANLEQHSVLSVSSFRLCLLPKIEPSLAL